MVDKMVQKNICDICGINEVFTFGDGDSNIQNYTCPYCSKEMCRTCIVIIKLTVNTIEDGKIIPSDNIELCKECYKNSTFSIKKLEK